MTLILVVSAQLMIMSFSCVLSAASSEHAVKDMTLLNSHSSVLEPRSNVDVSAAKNPPRAGNEFALTPAELRLAIQRKQNLEEARDANADARRIALESEHEMAALHGEAAREGVLLRFGDASFATGTTQLNSNSRDRLDELVRVLRNDPNRVLKIERSAQDARGTDTLRRLSVGRTEAIKHHLLRSGIAANRLLITVQARNDLIKDRDEGPVIHVLMEDR